MKKNKQFSNARVVIITGASQGIGKAALNYFRECGDKVFDLSRTTGTDVTNATQVREAIEKINAEHGRIDVLINNAGFGISGSAEGTAPEDANKLFAVNFNGVVNCCSAVLPHMRVQKSGLILNISSLAAVFALPFQSFYSASKAAVSSFSESLRTEVKPFSVKVTSVMLGDINTEFTANRRKNENDDLCYDVKKAKALTKYEHDEINGTCPKIIAQKLYKLSLKRNPKPVVTLCFKNKILALFAKLAPSRLKVWAVEKMY